MSPSLKVMNDVHKPRSTVRRVSFNTESGPSRAALCHLLQTERTRWQAVGVHSRREEHPQLTFQAARIEVRTHALAER